MQTLPSFAHAAARARRRLLLAGWVRLLNRTAWPLFAGAAAVLLSWRLCGHRFGGVLASVLILAAWLLATLCLRWWRRPSPVQSLAVWDGQRQRRDMFVSAYCFEGEAGDHPGRALHLARSRERLARDLPRMRNDLPVPRPVCALAPLILLAVSLSGTFQPPLASDRMALDGDALARAQALGREIEEDPASLGNLKGLDREEKEAIERLESAIDDTARRLAEASRRDTPRDIIEELEARAREAEALAESLDGTADELSRGMLSELERHADLSGLAAALREGDMAGVSDETRELAERLKREDMTLEEQKRLEDALSRSLAAGTEADRKRTLGRHMAEARRQLSGKQRLAAAREFERASERFKQRALRQQSRRRLQQLARQLRRRGAGVLGAPNSGLQRLQPPVGASSMRSLQSLQSSRLPFAQLLHGASIAQVPVGTGNLQGMAATGTLASASFVPVPGTFSPCGGKTGTPCNVGSIPVPGSGQGMGMGPGMGQGMGAPVPGTSGAGAQGGLQAGHGSAPYVAAAANLHGATDTGVVTAQDHAAGPASFRRVEGAPHTEQTARRSRELMIAFVRAEEEALSAEPIPLSRQNQVIHYFAEIRRQLEQQR